jgi:translation initiation factor IF-2
MTLNNNKIDYIHWNDPNELVDRLRLLEASRQAGNNAHDNEILSIIEELYEAGIIIK